MLACKKVAASSPARYTALQLPARRRAFTAHKCSRQQTSTVQQEASSPGQAPFLDAYAKGDKWPRIRLVHELLQDAGVNAAWMEFTPGFRALYVRDPGMVAEVLMDGVRFPNSLPGIPAMPELLGSSMSNVDDLALRRQHREALAPHFRTAYVGTLVPHLTKTAQEAAATLLAVSRDGGSCDMEDLFRRVVLDNFGRTDLGYEFHAVEDLTKPYDQRHLYHGKEFLQVWDRIMELTVRVRGVGEQRRQSPHYEEYTALLATVRGLLRERMAAARERLQVTGVTDIAQHADLVTLLLMQQASGDFPHLTDAVMEDELMLLMVGGFDTTASTLSWTLHYLLSNPRALAATVDEITRIAAGRRLPELKFEDYRRMEYLMACVTESMRLNMPLGSTTRRAAAATTLGGGALEVPAGTVVMVTMHGVHHHEDVYERAEEWLPERWLPDGPQELKPKHKDALLPFGAGPRVCIGRQYALLVMPVMLAQLLGTVRVAMAPDAPPVRLGPSVVSRSAEGIWVTAEPYAAGDGPGQP